MPEFRRPEVAERNRNQSIVRIEMELSEIVNVILGGGLLGTVAAIMSLRATVRKAKAEATRAEADAESVRLDNAEHATRILIENIVKPLKEEFNETKKELARNTREMARLRKAIDGANGCKHRDDCPVLERMREQPKGSCVGIDGDGADVVRESERKPVVKGQHKRVGGGKDGVVEGSDVFGESDDSDG